MAFGLESSVAKLVSMGSGMSTIPIKDATGWYGWSFWIPVVLCGFSFLVNIVYVVWERHFLPRDFRLTGARAAALASDKKAGISFAAVLLLPWAFWMLPITQLMQSEAAGAFGQSSSDLIRMKGYTVSPSMLQFFSGSVKIYFIAHRKLLQRSPPTPRMFCPLYYRRSLVIASTDGATAFT